MTTRPAVTVAICLFNSSRFIDETLQSVFAQTFEDYEVVLVDDGSSDGCADRIARHYRDARLRILRQPHQGLSHARRATIAAAAGQYVAFLDHDDLWLPDKLTRQMDTARRNPGLGLLCSDCLYIDELGQPLRLLSEQYDLSTLDESRGYEELLRRGCFVWQSTVLARTDALRSVNRFDPVYPYIADYDTWLQLSRRYPMHYAPEVLAKWRVHRSQFTTRCPEVTLADHRKLLGTLVNTPSIPASVRVMIGDRLLGQHRESGRILLRQRRIGLAVRAWLGMASQPGRLEDYLRDTIRRMPAVGRLAAAAYTAARRVVMAGVSLPRRLRKALTRANSSAFHIWLDGSALGVTQAGYFTFLSELIRSLRSTACVVHITCSSRGRLALCERLGDDSLGLVFHRPTLRPWPMGRPLHPRTIEVLVWRGRFRWAHSHRVAIVQDLTTQIHPECHTARNIADFEHFTRYVERHAHAIATPSSNSKRDIVERLNVFPDSVTVIPMPLAPIYRNPTFDPDVLRANHVLHPYLLSVGCLEPRKNLRRLVQAFETIQAEIAARNYLLVFAGPQGWDDDFPQFVAQSRARKHIRMLGLVPQAHLPTLYHYASAVVYPSLYEGFGLPVFEAMSCSSVVAASAISSLPEVLGDSGLSFDPYSTDAIAAVLLKAISMGPDEAHVFRRRARARAEWLLERTRTMPLLPGVPALQPAAAAS
ncbi:MAG TPA: glycosyltransferase [Vicinamibacterales bacterium]|nr:glycosyltransferase [Vicinamibacterales bacterium]